MKIVVWSLACMVACTPPSQKAQSPATKSTTSATDAASDSTATGSDFMSVLQIGRSREADAREQLRAIGDNATDIDARLAARRMIALWNDAERTYFSGVPLPLHRDCVDSSVLEIIRDRITKATLVDIQVQVSASGEVERITFRKNTDDEIVNKLIADSVRNRRFLPAKTGDNYVSGMVHVSCWIEVR